MAISRYLIDILTRHQVFLERLKSGEMRDFDAVLARLEKAVYDKLQAMNDPLAELSAEELDGLVREVFKAEEKVIDPWRAGLESKLEDAAGYEAEVARKALEHGVVSAVDVAPVSAAAAWAEALARPVQAQGKLLKPFIESWTTKTLEAVEGVIRNGHAQGFTVDEAVRAIRGTRANGYADGVATGMRRNIEALVRTSMQHVSNSARAAVFEANADIVTGERWISTLDRATCRTCAALDQRVFPFGKGPRPPIHLSDRCCMVPEMDESLELLGGGTRASKGALGGAQVRASQSYYGWLKTQPASFQDEAIGSERGKLLRAGGLTADEFARLNLGRNFAPLTLDEMRALAPAAFSKAGLGQE